MTKPATIRYLTILGDDEPPKIASFFLGDGPDAAQSNQWISAQVAIDMPPLKSLALLRIKALQTARATLDAEIQRLTDLYSQVEVTLR